jgi:hypothetical protein
VAQTAAPTVSAAHDAADPGDVEPEPPTLRSLGVRWPVRGDANRNAMIEVRYRRTGDVEWRAALPLFRTDPAKVSAENRVAGGWLFAGSIVDVAADTDYEVGLSLADPDGGGVERMLRMRTLREPRLPDGMRIRHVAAGADDGGTGTEGDPFRGLRSAQAAAQAGDLFLLRAGTYAVGRWTIDRHGVPGKPIVYRGAGDGPVVLDGRGDERLVSAPGARHVWLEGLVLRGARYLVVAHSGSDIVVRHCRFEVTLVGVAAINGGYRQSRGFVVTDNVFEGSSTWPRARGIESAHGLSVTGAGHVIAHNRFTQLGDGIHGTQHGRLSASDIHDNDFDVCTDDAIETDESDTNVRVFGNRITNSFGGVSAQPVNGGPVYVFRNAILNTQYSPFKLHNDTAGVLLFHNTSVRQGFPFHIDPAGETVTDVVSRNNLFVGTQAPALRSTGRMIRTDFDRDGFAWPRGPFALWNGRTYATAAEAARAGVLYRTLGAVVIDAARTFASGLGPPGDFRVRHAPAANDLRLREGSAAVDAGVVVPNVSDGYTGRAPDLGCCELGQPPPRYGPRPPES